MSAKRGMGAAGPFIRLLARMAQRIRTHWAWSIVVASVLTVVAGVVVIAVYLPSRTDGIMSRGGAHSPGEQDSERRGIEAARHGGRQAFMGDAARPDGAANSRSPEGPEETTWTVVPGTGPDLWHVLVPDGAINDLRVWAADVDRVVVMTIGEVRALHAQNGSTLWAYTRPGIWGYLNAAVSGNTLITFVQNSGIVGLSTLDGKVLFEHLYRERNPRIWRTLPSGDVPVTMHSKDSSQRILAIVDPKTGRIKRSVGLASLDAADAFGDALRAWDPDPLGSLGGFEADPQRIYMQDWGSFVTIDTATSAVTAARWRFGVCCASRAVNSDSRVYLVQDGGDGDPSTIWAYALDSNARQGWKTRLPGRGTEHPSLVRHFSDPIVVYNFVVISDPPFAWGLDCSSGRLLWESKQAGRLLAATGNLLWWHRQRKLVVTKARTGRAIHERNLPQEKVGWLQAFGSPRHLYLTTKGAKGWMLSKLSVP